MTQNNERKILLDLTATLQILLHNNLFLEEIQDLLPNDRLCRNFNNLKVSGNEQKYSNTIKKILTNDGILEKGNDSFDVMNFYSKLFNLLKKKLNGVLVKPFFFKYGRVRKCSCNNRKIVEIPIEEMQNFAFPILKFEEDEKTRKPHVKEAVLQVRYISQSENNCKTCGKLRKTFKVLKGVPDVCLFNIDIANKNEKSPILIVVDNDIVLKSFETDSKKEVLKINSILLQKRENGELIACTRQGELWKKYEMGIEETMKSGDLEIFCGKTYYNSVKYIPITVTYIKEALYTTAVKKKRYGFVREKRDDNRLKEAQMQINILNIEKANLQSKVNDLITKVNDLITKKALLEEQNTSNLSKISTLRNKLGKIVFTNSELQRNNKLQEEETKLQQEKTKKLQEMIHSLEKSSVSFSKHDSLSILKEKKEKLRKILSSIDEEMEKKYQEKQSENICSICVTDPKDYVIIPCMHRSCKKCSEQFDDCPFCRGKITDVRKLY